MPGLRWVVAVSSGLILGIAPLVSGPFEDESILKPYIPSSAHRAYGFLLARGGLARSDREQIWVTRSELAVFEPASVSTPFETTGTFDPDQPIALGYRFSGKAGKRIEIEVELDDLPDVPAVFIDLYRLEKPFPDHVASAAAPASNGAQRHHTLQIELLRGAEYVVRLQPELRAEGGYRLSIRSVPSLDFPVDGFDTRAILSGFGASRDGGAREHHGVDIFAPRGTPAVAALDARVSRVETTGRGGNVVWLQPLFGRLRLYYAHLDSQTVEPGQYVLAGETIGTVGNTGNARTTPPHLHFGVYVRRRGGAWDPYPFLE